MASLKIVILTITFAINLLSPIAQAQTDDAAGSGGDGGASDTTDNPDFIGGIIKGIMDFAGNVADFPLGIAGGALIGAGDILTGTGKFISPPFGVVEDPSSDDQQQ